MPLFCDVALAVPLDMVFTYAIPAGMEPVVGGRVLVPFRQKRMSGILVEVHDRAPRVKTKNVIEALDLYPVLDESLLKLGQWIAGYYLAPLGEVFRTMLPLSAEFKRSIRYRITDQGQLALHLGSTTGSPGRSRRTPEEQLVEFRVLDYLVNRDDAPETSVRSASSASRSVIAGMVRKKWIVREDISDARDAKRMVKVGVLRSMESAQSGEAEGKTSASGSTGEDARRSNKKLNTSQQTLIETLAAAGGRVAVDTLQT